MATVMLDQYLITADAGLIATCNQNEIESGKGEVQAARYLRGGDPRDCDFGVVPMGVI
jgi:hypothetical protein